MKGKMTLGAAWSVLFVFMFVLAVAGYNSVSSTADDSSWESRLEAAATLGEVRGVYVYAPRGSEVQKAAAKKLEAILKPILAAATTFEEVWEVCRDAPRGSEVWKAALEKMLSLATTLEEARKVSVYAPKGSEVRKAAAKKLEALGSNTK